MRKIMFLLPLLVACGPDANAPESVAGRFVRAQLSGDTAGMIALATRPDQAAAAQAPNTADKTLYPEASDQPLHDLYGARVKIAGASAQTEGDRASVAVTARVPDVDLSGVLMEALFGGGSDEAAMTRKVKAQFDKAPLKDEAHTLELVREDGQWRVDTDWAEKAQAKRAEDQRQAREAALAALQRDYRTGREEDLVRARLALKKLVATYPNDAGWKEEAAAVDALMPVLAKFTADVGRAGLYQGDYQADVVVTNGSAQPIKSFTLKLTFLNGDQPVGESEYETYSPGWFSSRVLDPGGSATVKPSGTPPEGWTGQALRAQVSATELDLD
ncbi:hypothetical protein [Deinococcus marmoris]